MDSKIKILNAVKYVGGTALIFGIVSFLFGFFVSDYSYFTGIGIGASIGAVFIFLMGVFFVVTEEMTEKAYKGINITQIKRKNGAPL